ncbi:MAG: ATP-binding protein [Clostridiales bacterium]|nr:ATP-binding protein [Clostridiales bacterium]
MEQRIWTTRLQNEKFLSMCAIEILSIPSFAITAYENEQDANAAYLSDMIRSLATIADIGRLGKNATQSDIVAELLWTAVPVQNQTYRAKIRLVICFRSMGAAQQLTEKTVTQAADAMSILLEIDRYTYAAINPDTFAGIIRENSYESMKAIVRSVNIESLPIPALQSCMHYDNIAVSPPHLEIMANAMIKSPGTIVSFQLLNTAYTEQEHQQLTSIYQALGMLSGGLHDPAFGVIPIVAAQRSIETYSYYHANAKKALYEFQVAVYGTAKTTDIVSFAVQSVLSGTGNTAFSAYALTDIPSQAIIDNYASVPWMLSQYLHARYPMTALQDCNRFPYIITAEEAAILFSLPVGGKQIGAGFTVDHSEKQGKEYRSSLINTGDITIGHLKSSGGFHTFGISRNDLAKHMLIVGTPGSGKTTFSVGMLDRLWKQGVPFLVIEPAKNEYRALVQSIPDLQVFTPGKTSISPFVFNPFVLPDNVRLESWKSTLKTAFAAGVSMTTPLDKIFEDTINNCYADFGWLDTYTSADKGQVFNIADFIQSFQKTFDNIGYTGEVGNIGKAGVVRLKGLTNLFDNYHSIPIADLLKKPTVIELAAIENSDEKALIIALLLLSILSYVNANYSGDSGLQNVILLEEAHVLLDAQSSSGQVDANPSAIAQGLVKRMLAELRSYGISLVIADQSPRKVTTDVVALTDIKLAFRLVESVDKQIIEDSTNMSEQQASRLSRLKPGEAFFFFNKLEEPEEVITENYRLENKIDITLSDSEIARLSTYWNSRRKLLLPYPECANSPFCSESCDYHTRILAREIARRIFTRHILSARPEGNTQKELLQAQKTAIKQVFSRLVTISRAEASGEEITPLLLACIKIHLFRRIRYETKVRIPEAAVANSLK